MDDVRTRLLVVLDDEAECVAEQDQGGSVIWTGLANDDVLVDRILAVIQDTHVLVPIVKDFTNQTQGQNDSSHPGTTTGLPDR
jgi:hypothetical protein